jgi:predicted DNA-binding transcriptional regulator YafY
MSSSYNQIAFALEILKLLAEKPHKRKELADLLSAFLEKQGKTPDDVLQKLTRTIRQLRDCGFEIKSATHSPYQLLESKFPVILSPEQRQALYMAAHFLADMGFTAQAGQIIRISKFSETDQLAHVRADFSPPVDYSENQLSAIVQQLQHRFQQQRRYTIFYQNSQSESRIWDLDYSELRLHNGVMYLFAFVPDSIPPHPTKSYSAEQNFLFRTDRIKSVNAPSAINWFLLDFPTLTISYRLDGYLWNYQPRRNNERVLERHPDPKYVDIETKENCLFWFRQRMMQYGSNVKILEPEWLAVEIRDELKKAYQKYE